jgi:hypothetical protein
VRTLRFVVVGVGVMFLMLAVFKLNDRRVDRPGLCGSVLQGARFDDGGSRTPDCNHLRHDDEVAAAAFVLLGAASFGLGAGLTIHARNG